MNLFINRNKLTEIENKLMVTKGNNEGQIGIYRYTILYIK